MSNGRGHSFDRTEWVKWPHMETHWQPQHYETPQKGNKKGVSNSHSWWWDSHISPKNSKWLQENLAEMDSKVNAMLKIIEEDADSFAKRAEMYYKRRPELVSLVEDFYRTYRALMERYTFLAKEVQQNTSMSTQALKGLLCESPPKADVFRDPHATSPEVFDIASLSSLSVPGTSDADDNGLSYMSSEEEPISSDRDTEIQKRGDSSILYKLRKRIQSLQDERRVLTLQLGEADVKIKELQSEASKLQAQMKTLEADSINSPAEVKQSLEHENLKLNHALVTCKEENTLLREAREELQRSFTASQDEYQRQIFSLTRKYNNDVVEVQKYSAELKTENERLKQQVAKQRSANHGIEQEAREIVHNHRSFQKDMLTGQEFTKSIEHEGHPNKGLEWQREVESTEINSTQRMEQINQRGKRDSLSKVTARGMQVLIDKSEADNEEALEPETLSLRAEVKDLQNERNNFDERCQLLASRCKELEAAETMVKEQHASLLEDHKCLREEKITCECMLIQATLEVEELRSCLSSFSSDNSLLLETVSQNVSYFQVGKDYPSNESEMKTTHLRDLEIAISKLIFEKEMLEKERAEALHLLSDLEKTSVAEIKHLKQAVEEHLAHIAELESSFSSLAEQNSSLEEREKLAELSNSQRKEQLALLEAQRMETSEVVEQMTAHLKEMRTERDTALAKCQESEAEYLALQTVERNLNTQLELKLGEMASVVREKSAGEAEYAKLQWVIEKMQSQVASISAQEASLRIDFREPLEQIKIMNTGYSNLQKIFEEYNTQLRLIDDELNLQSTRVKQLEEDVYALSDEKKHFEHRESEFQMALVGLQEEKYQLLQEIKQKDVLQDGLKEIIASFDNEKQQLSNNLQQAEQQILSQQEVIAGFSMKYTEQTLRLSELEKEVSLLKIEKENTLKALSDKFEGNICELEIKISDLLVEKTAANDHREQMETALSDMHKGKEVLSEELVTIMNNMTTLKEQLKCSQESENTQKANLQNSVERIQALNMEVERLLLWGTKAEESAKSVNSEHSKCLDEIAQLQKRIVGLESEIAHHAEGEAHMKEQNEKLNYQLKNSRDMRQELESELLKLHQILASADDVIAISPLQEEPRSMDASFSISHSSEHMQCKIRRIMEERSNLAKMMKSQKEDFASMAECLEKEKDAIQRQLLHVMAENETVVRSLSLEVEKKKQLENEMRLIQQKLDTSIQEKLNVLDQLKLVSREEENLHNDLKSLRDKLKENELIMHETSGNLDKLNCELTLSKQAHAVTQNDLLLKCTELSSTQKHVVQLLSSKDILEERVQQYISEIKNLNEKLMQLQCQLKNSESMRQELESVLLKLHQMLNSTEDKNRISADQERSRCLDADFSSTDGTEQVQLKVRKLVEERGQLVSAIEFQKDEFTSMTESLKREMDAMQRQMLQVIEEKETVAKSLAYEAEKGRQLENETRRIQQQLNDSIHEKLTTLDQLNLVSDEREKLCNDLKALQDEVKNHQQAMNEAAVNLERLNSELSLLRQAHTGSQNDLVIQGNELSSAREHVSRLLAAKRVFEDEVQKHRTEIQNLNEEIMQLQHQLESATNSRQELEFELLKIHLMLTSTEGSNASSPIQKHSRSLNANFDFSVGMSEQIHGKVRGLMEERNQLVRAGESQKDDFSCRIEHFEKEKNAVQRQLLQIMQERETIAKSLTLEVEKGKQFEDEMRKMQQKLDISIQEKQRVLDQLKLVSEEGDVLHTHMKSLQAEANKSQLAMLEAVDDLEKSKSELTLLKQAHAVMQNDLLVRSSELSSAQEHVSHLLSSKGGLEEEVRQHLSEVKNLNAEIMQLQHQLQYAEDEVLGLKDEMTNLMTECSTAKRAAHDSNQEMASMAIRVRKLEIELSSTENDKKLLSDHIKGLQCEIKIASEEKESLMLQVESGQTHLSEKQQEKEKLQEQLRAKQGDVLSLTDIMEQLKQQWGAEKERLNDELTRMTSNQKDMAIQEKESLNKLRYELTYALQEKERLEKQCFQVQDKLNDAERTLLLAKEELAQNHASRDAFESAMATYLSNVGSLEHNLANVKNEKQTLDSRVEEIQLKITGMEGEMEILKARLETAILELERKECEVSNLKNKLNSAEIHSCSLEAALLETKSSLGTRLEILQLELAQSRASNLQVQDDLAMQVRNVLKLRQESEVLHGHLAQVQQDKDLCKMEVDKLRREAADLFHQLGNAEKRESEIISERLELLASLESLKQALADKNMENLSLTEELRKFSDFQNATEQRFKEEIEHLQNEETKWRNEFAANSALMSEKVANLRQENASLHKDLSTKIESFLELKQKIEFLTEENRRLSRKCEKTNKEISSLRDHLQILQDIVIPSSDEKIVELQNEIKYLITSNGQYIDEADRMRMLLKGAKDELLLLQQESFSSKLELIFNVEMMKHAEDLLGEAWKRNTELCEDLRSEMKQTQILEQMVASINAENEALSATLSSENATLAEGVHFLLGIIIQVAELERELVSARTDTPLRKCIDSTTENLDKFVLPMKIEAGDFVLNEDQNDDVSQYVREARVFMKLWLSEVERRLLENDEKGTSPSTLHQRGLILSIIHSLKEEVGLLQRKLHEMQLDASSIQCNNRDVSLDDIMEFSSPRKSSTASSSSILTVDDIQAGKDGIGELKDDIQRLVEENKQLKEEIISLRSKFVAAWMDQENLVESVDVPGRQLGTDMHEENEFSDVVASSGQGLLKFRIEHAPLDMEGSIAEGRKSLGIHSVKDETINGDPLVTSKKGPGSVITEGSTSDKMVLNAEASERPHIKLAQRLHQAFVDEKLEHELLELKQGRKQLKEVLRSRSQDIQRMESEIEDLEALIKEAHWKTDHNIEKKKRLDSTEEGLSELAGILTKQKEQIYKMEKEVMSTEEQKEAAAENHLSLLIELESAPGMEGWKEEQAICANEELERLRSLNRRHSLELETMNVHLQNIEAVIVSAQQQMREASSGGGGEVMASLASLNVQTRSTTIDFRSQGSQELLTPSLPHTTKELEKESTSDVGKHGISSRSSDGALGRLPLKARNLGSSWFMLMFSPERKTPRLARGSNSNKAAWRRSSRSVSGTAALDVVRRSRRKAAACLACTAPKAIRVESFDCRT